MLTHKKKKQGKKEKMLLLLLLIFMLIIEPQTSKQVTTETLFQFTTSLSVTSPDSKHVLFLRVPIYSPLFALRSPGSVVRRTTQQSMPADEAVYIVSTLTNDHRLSVRLTLVHECIYSQHTRNWPSPVRYTDTHPWDVCVHCPACSWA